MAIKRLKISDLTPLPDGLYGIYINDKLWGFINAHPKAEFHVLTQAENAKGEPHYEKYPAGRHQTDVSYSRVEMIVKDLPHDYTFYDVDRCTTPEAKADAERKNKETMDLILGRVRVTQVSASVPLQQMENHGLDLDADKETSDGGQQKD